MNNKRYKGKIKYILDRLFKNRKGMIKRERKAFHLGVCMRSIADILKLNDIGLRVWRLNID